MHAAFRSHGAARAPRCRDSALPVVALAVAGHAGADHAAGRSPPVTAAVRGLADYLAGLQCERQLWLAVRADTSPGRPVVGPPAPRTGPATESQTQLQVRLAERFRIPGALAALAPHAAQVRGAACGDEALRESREWIGDPAWTALAGAVFERDGWRARADLIERSATGDLHLRLLVADVAVRELDLDRAALLAFLIERDGRSLAGVEIWVLDRDYQRGPAEIDWCALIRRRDVTSDVRLLQRDVPRQLANLTQVGARSGEPEVEPSPHCSRPFRCEFWEHCTRALPQGALLHLPRLRAEQFHALRAAGIARIAEIPAEHVLEPIQVRTREAWRRGGAVAAPALAARLRAIGRDVAYLDFETAVPAVPLLPRSGPFEPIPVQWSLLRGAGSRAERESVGGEEGADFVAEPGADPRRAFAESLLAALAASSEPIAVYSEFEANVLQRLEALLPSLAAELARVRARLVDLLELTREHVAHPEFLGSYSLKRVAPVLCPKVTYGDLREVASGADAARVLDAWITGASPAGDRERLSAALRAYCRRDVVALRSLHEALWELAERTPS
jgi:predicted RecB family nuclease